MNGDYDDCDDFLALEAKSRQRSKKLIVLVISLGLGLYFGYLIGTALIASAMNPVGAGFLAALLTAMIILALAAALWGMCGQADNRNFSVEDEQKIDYYHITSNSLGNGPKKSFWPIRRSSAGNHSNDSSAGYSVDDYHNNGLTED